MDYKNKHTYILFVILLAMFAIIAFTYHQNSSMSTHTATSSAEIPGSCGNYQKGIVMIGTTTISVDISNTECKRVLGLSGRTMLPIGMGMIFVFDVAGQYPFWMQDMNFPLDMVWVGSDFVVTGIAKNVSPDTFNAKNPSLSQTFGGQYLAEYVLELPAGFTDEKNIQVGNKISFSEKAL